MMNDEVMDNRKSRYIKEGERLDDLQIKGYGIIQTPGKFCFGMDAVLLSSFAKIKKQERALDLGTGTGILPILLEAKNEGEHYTGLEIQKESVDMARRSIEYNGLEDKVDVEAGDIRNASGLFGAASFQVVTVNPPYMIGKHGLKNENEALYIARHEVLCTLDDVLRESARLLTPKGRFYMVHRPFRLPEILAKMSAYRIEPKRMRLVHPYVDKEPNMVLVEGLRGGNPRMKVEPPLVVYEKDGRYTEELLRIYGMRQ
ncbi:tRNA1(Val) (adenine(37)-N6)-methyltransferase [Lachnospiraceae bacterium 48-21]